MTSALAKTCSRCQEPKSLEAFYPLKGGKYRAACVPCVHQMNRESYWRNIEKRRAYDKARLSGSSRQTAESVRATMLRRVHKMELSDYDEMHDRQIGLCAICGDPETIQRHSAPLYLAIDHDHSTGCRRDLLCNRCNLLLGKVKDSTALLEAAIRYLKKWSADAPPERLGWYLSGSMSGQPDHNFPAFNETARRLREAGRFVVNPADRGIVEGWAWADYLTEDLQMLLSCEGIYMLKGWEGSPGANLELHVARALGLAVEYE